nr:protein nhr-16 [imported] - Caenorhabditis elegans [Caenorhabditis elegans]
MGPRQKDKDQSKCSICREPGDGFHFGAEACRACAAFFRRTVSNRKTYSCQGNNDCDVTINIRCMCRACRYIKCIEVGMNPAGVQQRLPPSKTLVEVSMDLPTVSNPSILSFPSPPSSLMLHIPSSYSNQMPILDKMRKSYETLCNARKTLHRKDGANIFQDNVPKPVTYKKAIDQGMKDVKLTSDWVSWCFEDFKNLSIDQKKILFHNAYTPYFMMEGGFLSHIRNTPEHLVMPSGDYIDTLDLNSFYNCSESDRQISSKEIDRLFKPSNDRFIKSVTLPMMSLQLDIFEFFVLFTLLLWDTGLIEISEECIEIGTKVKTQVLKELDFYMRNVKKVEEPLVRTANIVNLLPAVQKGVRRIQDDLEVTKVFDLYTASDEFYNLMSGRF